MELIIHRFLDVTKAEGPGLRACLWVQGCPIHCKGCGVPWTWSKKQGTIVDTDEVAQWIKESKESHHIEGVTFLGGEPFEQAPALAELGQVIQKMGLSIMTFSGYYLEQLKEKNKPGTADLLTVTDLLIDGPFVEEELDTSRPWVGSSNQRYHFLSERYRDLAPTLLKQPNRVEIRLHEDGEIEMNGMATKEQLERLFDRL